MRIEHYVKRIPPHAIDAANDYLDSGAFRWLLSEVASSLRAEVGGPRAKTAALYFQKDSGVEVRRGSCTCGKHKEKKPCAHVAAIITEVARGLPGAQGVDVSQVPGAAGVRSRYPHPADAPAPGVPDFSTPVDIAELKEMIKAFTEEHDLPEFIHEEVDAALQELWPPVNVLKVAIDQDGLKGLHLLMGQLLASPESGAALRKLIPREARVAPGASEEVLAQALAELPAFWLRPLLVSLTEEIPDLLFAQVRVQRWFVQRTLPSLSRGLHVPATVDYLRGRGELLEEMSELAAKDDSPKVWKDLGYNLMRLVELQKDVAAFAKTQLADRPADAFAIYYTSAICAINTLDVGLAELAQLVPQVEEALDGAAGLWPVAKTKLGARERERIGKVLAYAQARPAGVRAWVVPREVVEVGLGKLV